MRTGLQFGGLLFVALLAFGLPLASQDYAIGADVSFLAQAEHGGVVFKDNGTAKPALQILHDHGYNWIRLRVFHTPKELPNNLAYTIAIRGFFDTQHNVLPVISVFDRFSRK
jgi:arabinogalactan endo-1,4-beta-galactosidase